ncbi:MAG: hypothetical protein MJ252_15215, partial [archaeon]|nr:hypothetical protein [archaeon]
MSSSKKLILYSPHRFQFVLDMKGSGMSIEDIKEKIHLKYGYLKEKMRITVLGKDNKEEQIDLISDDMIGKKYFVVNGLEYESVAGFLAEKVDYSKFGKNFQKSEQGRSNIYKSNFS